MLQNNRNTIKTELLFHRIHQKNAKYQEKNGAILNFLPKTYLNGNTTGFLPTDFREVNNLAWRAPGVNWSAVNEGFIKNAKIKDGYYTLLSIKDIYKSNGILSEKYREFSIY